MNAGLRNEIALLTGLTSLGFWMRGKNRLAAGTALLALGFRMIPSSGFSFQNRSVVITGGSRGLGLALAEQLVREGALVTLLARDSEELDRAALQLESLRGVSVLTVVCDVSNRNQLRSAFQKVKDHFGGIDILINNAGSVTAGPFEAMNQADFEAQMNLHFFAVLKSLQMILPTFRSQGHGRILNVCSIGGKVPVPHMAAYCASKFALAGFSLAITPELKKEGILVTTVCPGLMRTGSPVQGVFKGNHQKEFAWFALSDSAPGISMPAERAAGRILKALRSGKTDVIISMPAKLGFFVSSNFPEIFQATLTAINRILPDGESQERKTGAASRTWLDQQSWARPFLKILNKAQGRFNEQEKYDANFNLNLGTSSQI